MIKLLKYFILFVTLLSCCLVETFNYQRNNQTDDFELILLHNNDIHGRFDETDINGGTCTPQLSETQQCYGGFARIAHIIRLYRNMAKLPGGNPVIFLNAGDMYTGTVWFSIFKEKISTEFMNLIQPDAITIGNHEFDNGIEGLIPFLEKLNSPFVVSNLDLNDTPELQSIKNLMKSTILTINNIKIGIVGYLTPETIGTTSTGNVKITPEIDAINEETLKLKQQDVKIIIALGHSGYEMDKKIAQNCPDIDVVVGGHSHSFLWSGNYLENEEITENIEGPYPTGVSQSNGKLVPVVQASAFTKYLGYLKLKFNKNGDLLTWNGTPIILDSTITQDSDILNLINIYRPDIDAIGITIGQTSVNLNGERNNCRNMECVMGNLIADSYLDCANEQNLTLSYNSCISLVNSGSIRGSINQKTLNGSITLYDIMSTLPYNSSISMAEFTGKEILNILEKSASYYQTDNGGFLQMSGIHVTFDMTKPIGQRVTKVLILNDCNNSKNYELLIMEKKYYVVTLDYLLNGGDGYNLDYSNKIHLNCTDLLAVTNYIMKYSPIQHQLEGRQIQIQI